MGRNYSVFDLTIDQTVIVTEFFYRTLSVTELCSNLGKDAFQSVPLYQIKIPQLTDQLKV